MNYSRGDFNSGPMVVFYEVTRACDLACKHCRACAQPARDPAELSAESSRALIDQLATFAKPPLVVFTGGDPLKRPDIYELVSRAASAGLEAAMTPSVTPLLTRAALGRLREAGLSRLAVSLDGADASAHDDLRGVPGSFDRTLEVMTYAAEIDLPLQVNTTITRMNLDQVDRMVELLSGRRIVLWSVFFLVPVGRGADLLRIGPEDYERVFERLWRHAQRREYGIKTTEAPHYRRFVLQRRTKRPPVAPDEAQVATDDPLLTPARPTVAALWEAAAGSRRAPLGINDGKGVMFIDHTGAVFPTGFLPIRCGQFPADSVVDVYRNSPLFQSLRDPDRLGGKCGVCEFRHACGGSRARAYAVTGDPLAAEPDCAYFPPAWSDSRSGRGAPSGTSRG